MLTEDAVVDAVRSYLEARGWICVKSATAVGKQRGEDLVMQQANLRLSIEAKGETSSDPESSRFNLPFNSGQIGSHIGRAVVTALAVVSAGVSHAAIALPATPAHRSRVDAIAPALARLGVSVFWVEPNGAVSVAPDRLGGHSPAD